LLDDVKFDLVGLHSSRTYGLKATGMMSFINSMQAFIVANPNAVDQVGMMYEMARELIGPDEADAFIKVPTPIDKLRSQAEENEGLINGEEIEVDKDDNDQQHLQDMQDLFERAMDKDSKMHFDVRRVVLQHAFQHGMQLKAKEAQKQAMEQRRPTVTAPAEAGGEPSSESGKSSPPAGGMSNAMQDLADSPGGQTQGENPGPADMNKTSRTGTKRRPVNQTDN
jgi:hypothetical protein